MLAQLEGLNRFRQNPQRPVFHSFMGFSGYIHFEFPICFDSDFIIIIYWDYLHNSIFSFFFPRIYFAFTLYPKQRPSPSSHPSSTLTNSSINYPDLLLKEEESLPSLVLSDLGHLVPIGLSASSLIKAQPSIPIRRRWSNGK